jgi:hypothetical protein
MQAIFALQRLFALAPQQGVLGIFLELLDAFQQHHQRGKGGHPSGARPVSHLHPCLRMAPATITGYQPGQPTG